MDISMKIAGALHLAKANIKRNRNNTISLALLIIMITGIAGLGLTILGQIQTIYDQKINDLNSLHFAYAVSRAEYEDQYETFLTNDDRVSEYTIQSAVMMANAHINVGGEIDSQVIFLNRDSPNTISAFKPVDQEHLLPSQQLPPQSIYLPYLYRQKGYETGDLFSIQYKNIDFSYTIAGFFETADLSKTVESRFKFYLPAADFEALKAQIGETNLMLVRLYDPSLAGKLKNDFIREFDIEVDSFLDDDQFFTGYDDYMTVDMMMVYVMGSTIITFSLIAALICFMMIGFRVKSSIEERMNHIGVLGAAGYTSAEIKLSLVLEYTLIALPASLVGCMLSYLFLPLIDSILLTLTGLFLTADAQPAVTLCAAFTICLFLIFTVILAGRTLHRLSPVTALRGGLSTHSFRRNFLPLDKSLMPMLSRIHIDIRLGLKNIFVHFRLYLMIAVVTAGMAMMITCVATLFINFALEQELMIKMAGMETVDVTLNLAPHTDADAFAAELETMPEVRKTSMLDMRTLLCAEEDESRTLSVYVSDDFSRMEVLSTYQGHLPVWENEIVMTESYARSLGKQMGDLISLKKNGVVKEYLVTGFFSSTNNGGGTLLMTLDGFRRLSPDYRRQSVNVYFAESVDYDHFTDKIKEIFGVVNVIPVRPDDPWQAAKIKAEEKIAAYLEQYGVDSVEYAVSLNGELIMTGSSTQYQILKIVDWQEYLKTQIGSFSTGMSSLLGLIILFSLLLISLILYMTNKTILRKRQADFGILKAGGFETRQLMVQMLFSFVPSALSGSLIGCAAGAWIINPVLLAVLSVNGGIANIELIISPIAILLICFGIFGVTMAVTALSTASIRNISVYQLISE